MRQSTPLELSDLQEMLRLMPELEQHIEIMQANMNSSEALGDAFAVRWDTALLGCGGLLIPWPGVAVAWMILTPTAKKHPIATYRAIRSFLVDRVAKYDLVRIEASIHTHTSESRKLAETLGFTCEGLRLRYLPDGHDAWLYAWIRED